MTYFIIHGAMGNNRENWLGWLEDYLRAKRKKVINPNFPTPEDQHFDTWSVVLNKYLRKINKRSVFICHSVGSAFIVKYVITNKIKINKLVSVAGANNFMTGITEFDEINASMFLPSVEEFKKYCKKVVCFYSTNDSYLKFADMDLFAKSLGAVERVYKKAGHFNQASGYTKFEDVLQELPS